MYRLVVRDYLLCVCTELGLCWATAAAHSAHGQTDTQRDRQLNAHRIWYCTLLV